MKLHVAVKVKKIARNMGYCRFQNTLNDLRDCHNALVEMADPMEGEEETLSREENEAKDSLIALCRRIAEEFDENETFD